MPSLEANGSRSENPAGRWELKLFGGFSLFRGDQRVDGMDHARLQHLLAYLALHRGHPISRQQLAFEFWPDTNDPQALKNLRTLLTRLRQALPDVNAYLEVSAQSIQWRNQVPFTLDIACFEEALAEEAAARESGDRVVMERALSTAVKLYAGDLLPGCYSEWILPLRERYHQAYGRALHQLVECLEENRAYQRALPLARRLLEHDPLCEASYHQLIRLHLAVGDRAEALRTCQACDSMLQQEFGIQPERSTRSRYLHLLEAKEPRAPAYYGYAQNEGVTQLPLVGRNAEWTRLLAAWRTAMTRGPHMVLLSGEAGIGKTRLAEELCDWVARQGVVVSQAYCLPAGGNALAYAPVIDWLRGTQLQPRLSALPDIWRVEISRILPSILTDRAPHPPAAPLVEAWQRTRLFEDLARAFLGQEEGAPLLLFLDDLQWCDQETLDWLGYLLRYAPGSPLLIITTVRKYEIDRQHPLMAFWLALTRAGLLTEISLEPFSEADSGLLAAQIAGWPMNASQTAQIFRRTEGNPLFIVEMMRAGMAEQRPGSSRQIASAPDEDQWIAAIQQHLPSAVENAWPASPGRAAVPPKVRAVIEWRLAQLSPEARALLQAAAVVGHSFTVDLLAQASGLSQESVIEGLDELWQRHLVIAPGGSTYTFSHDAIRVVTYTDTVPIRRQAIHLRVARAIEGLDRDNPMAASLQIASHYEQAGWIATAIAGYQQAAAAAEGVYANAAAAYLYQHILESDLRQGLNPRETCGLVLALARVMCSTGQWTQAERMVRKALAESTALEDARLGAQARQVLADVLQRLGYYDAALQFLDEAQQSFAAARDEHQVARCLKIAGEIYWLRGDHPQALNALEQKLKIAADMNDENAISEALQAIGTVQWSQGHWDQARATCLKAIQVATPLENKPVLTRASITLGNIHAGEHRQGEAVDWYLRAGSLARETDDRQALSWAISSIAQILAKRGEYQRAAAAYERSLHIAWEIGDRWSTCWQISGLAVLGERMGRMDEAETLYLLAVDLGQRLNIPILVTDILPDLARLYLALGRLDEARSTYQDAFTRFSNTRTENQAGEALPPGMQILDIRLRHALGEISNETAQANLRAMLQSDEPDWLAEVYEALCQLSPDNMVVRAEAGRFFRARYDQTGEEESRQRYQQCTGEFLPDLPPLADISGLIPAGCEANGVADVINQLKTILG